MSKHILFIIIGTLLISHFLSVHIVRATTPVNPNTAFRSYLAIDPQPIIIPTVIEIPLPEPNSSQYLIIRSETNEPQPYQIANTYSPTPYAIIDPEQNLGFLDLTDNNITTFAEFAPQADTLSTVTFNVNFSEPITSSALTLLIPENVLLPETVTLKINVGQNSRILINQAMITSPVIRFPSTTSQFWQLTFSYRQNLRISEIHFQEQPKAAHQRQAIRFLSRPGESYELYFDPDRPVVIDNPISGNLLGEQNPLILENLPQLPNPAYLQADQDTDKLPDSSDNCPLINNPDQLDINHNQIGDACEDFDYDGVLNSRDSCPDHPNPLQQNHDGDGLGDHCDGSESRLVEQLPWLPWLGIILGFGIVMLLLRTTVKYHQTHPDQGSTINSKN